jgi:pilus assembly protein FimV
MALLKDYWLYAAGGLAVVLALLFLVAARRRREAASAYAPVSPSLDDFELPGERDVPANTFPLRRPTDGRDSSIVVEETGVHERTTTRKGPLTVDLDDAGSGSESMRAATMEQGDPLAEADFHMAYGLYDQAADLVKAALQREPQRRDLKLKLLEVFFVWGNKDQFLQAARELAKVRETAAPGEWEKVVIMGKQLAPEDVLFHQSSVGAQTSVDLNLEGGQNLVDFDLPDPDDSSDAGTVDMQLSSTDTGLKPLGADTGLDFILDDPARGDDYAPTATTRQMAQPGLDTVNAPTLEQPQLDPNDTLAGKLDARHSFAGSHDQTAELALDDLGLDLGKLEATGTGMMPSGLGDDDDPADGATLMTGLDETSRGMLAGAESSQRTEMLPLTDLDLGGTGTDLDIDFGSETGKSPALTTGVDLDLDVGNVDQSDAGDWQKTQRIDLATLNPDEAGALEPVTMSEVGTKLDLARAYMDMGDPDGARSILNEVLQEGSDGQRQEATRLLNSIPG